MIRVALPAHLRTLASLDGEVKLHLPDAPLPDAVATGAEPSLVVGAIAGG